GAVWPTGSPASSRRWRPRAPSSASSSAAARRNSVPDPDWEQRLSDLWASIDDLGEDEFLARMDELAAELPAESAVARFERASGLDSTGHSDLAVPLYRQALEL